MDASMEEDDFQSVKLPARVRDEALKRFSAEIAGNKEAYVK